MILRVKEEDMTHKRSTNHESQSLNYDKESFVCQHAQTPNIDRLRIISEPIPLQEIFQNPKLETQT